MLPINLDDLLCQRTVESERIEYKAGWNPDAIVRTLCAFANDFENLGGGYVVVGMGCKLIVLQAPGGMNRPYKAPSSVSTKHKVWHYYIRRYSSTVEAKGEAEVELLSLSANVPWDDRFTQQAKLSDLSHPLMMAYLQEVGSKLADDAPRLSVETLGRQMNVVGGPSESPCPKNVGLLLFNSEPDRFFPYAQIDVIWFPEGAGGDRFDEKIFKGPLARMTREALGYIQRNYLHETVLKHPNKAEATRVWNFPYAAVEEALVNAVYHRSYEEREPIEVRISHTELVILSFPGPGRSIRMSDFEAGRSVSRRYRNRRIGEFLKELELTEGRFTGVPKTPVHPLAQAPEVMFNNATDQVTDQVTNDVARLLHAAEKGEQPRSALQAALGLQHTPHFRQAYLLPALTAGYLEMTLPDKPRSSKQHYRLTVKGRQWVKLHFNVE